MLLRVVRASSDLGRAGVGVAHILAMGFLSTHKLVRNDLALVRKPDNASKLEPANWPVELLGPPFFPGGRHHDRASARQPRRRACLHRGHRQGALRLDALVARAGDDWGSSLLSRSRPRTTQPPPAALLARPRWLLPAVPCGSGGPAPASTRDRRAKEAGGSRPVWLPRMGTLTAWQPQTEWLFSGNLDEYLGDWPDD
jgi:hypothetical protein